MFVKFWGVRGSIPTPVGRELIREKIIKALSGAGGVDLNDPLAVRAYVESLPFEIQGTSGGNTSCVEVKTRHHHIILDAGSGLRELGLSLMTGPFGRGEGSAHIFLSHTHWDHIQGFPFFVPAYIPGNRLFIYSPKEDVEETFILQQVDSGLFPIKLEDMAAHKEFVTIGEDGIDLGELKVDCLPLHHPGGSHAYRIEAEGKALVYATDGEYKNLSQTALQPYLDFFSGAEALVFDAQYTFAEYVAKEDWGHSTSLVGVDMAVNAGVKRLFLFHHDPTYNDDKLSEIMEKTNAYHSYIPDQNQLEIILAVEGMELEF